jgi:hypothetical protein
MEEEETDNDETFWFSSLSLSSSFIGRHATTPSFGAPSVSCRMQVVVIALHLLARAPKRRRTQHIRATATATNGGQRRLARSEESRRRVFRATRRGDGARSHLRLLLRPRPFARVQPRIVDADAIEATSQSSSLSKKPHTDKKTDRRRRPAPRPLHPPRPSQKTKKPKQQNSR